MADLHIKVGGVWKAINTAYVKVGGAWKTVDAAYIKTAGAWKTAWQNISYALSGETIQDSEFTSGTADASVRVNTDGTIDKIEGITTTQIDSATDWVIPNSTASTVDHWVRATQNSQTGGGTTSGPALGTWWKVSGTGSANREWKISSNFGAAESANWNITLAIATDASGTNIVATGTYDLTAFT